MDEEAVFKRYDIRGRYPDEIDEEFARLLGRSLGTFISGKFPDKVVVTRDNKNSSEDLKQSFTEGLVSAGAKVLDAGTGPTDYTAYTGRKHNTVSVQVTSSHLPLEFNGFKFMYPKGNGFLNPDLDAVKDIFRRKQFEEGEAEVEDISRSFEDYRDGLREFAREKADSWDRKIVVDSLGGASDPVLKEVLEELGAEVVDIAEDKDRKPYRNPPNPRPGNLDELKRVVEDTGADLGIAADMDGDRATVYRDGFIDGSEILGVLAEIIRGDVVASIDTSKAVEKAVKLRGDRIFYTRVGDPFVMDKALEEEVRLAGEPNGHYAFPEFVPYHSGTLAALILSGIDLERYLERLPAYFTERRSIEVEDKEERMKALEKKLEEKYGIESRKDGLKLESPEFNALVRPSGSSSKIRITVESETENRVKEIVEQIEEMVRKP